MGLSKGHVMSLSTKGRVLILAISFLVFGGSMHCRYYNGNCY